MKEKTAIILRKISQVSFILGTLSVIIGLLLSFFPRAVQADNTIQASLAVPDDYGSCDSSGDWFHVVDIDSGWSIEGWVDVQFVLPNPPGRETVPGGYYTINHTSPPPEYSLFVSYPPAEIWPISDPATGMRELHVDISIGVYDQDGVYVETLGPGQDWNIWCRLPSNTPTPTSTSVIPTDTPTNTTVPPSETPTNTPTNTSIPPSETPTNTPTGTPIVVTDTPTPTGTLSTPTFTDTPEPSTATPTSTDTPIASQITPTLTEAATATPTATQTTPPTLPPPPQTTTTPGLIPVTGVDLSGMSGPGSVYAGLLINIGIGMIGLALVFHGLGKRLAKV